MNINYDLDPFNDPFANESETEISDALATPLNTTSSSIADPNSQVTLPLEATFLPDDLPYTPKIHFLNEAKQETFGCVFVGHDISDSLLKFEEDDSQVLEKKRLEQIAQQKRIENINHAHQIFMTLPQIEIIYPGAQQLDLSPYLGNKKIDVLKKLLESTQDKPIYFIYPNATHEEINSIRDAMITNPKLTYVGLKSDYFTLWEAFHQAGYSFTKNFLKRKLFIKGGEFYGVVFRGR